MGRVDLLVVLLWCAADRRFRIPVAFRLWRPKRACAPHRYQTNLELAAGMLTELVAVRLPSVRRGQHLC